VAIRSKERRAHGYFDGAPNGRAARGGAPVDHPDNSPQAPTADEVACVARVVVQDPVVDQIANDMAQIRTRIYASWVMTSYLGCAHISCSICTCVLRRRT